MVCGWVEVCIRKEDVVLLSRKGRGCLLCVSNMQVLGMLVFFLSNDLLEVNDGSDEKWIQTLQRADCCCREMGPCCNACALKEHFCSDNRGCKRKVIWAAFFLLLSRI